MTPEEMRRRIEAGEDPLELSIQKWQDIVDGTGECFGAYNCALCYIHIDSYCKGCPINEAGHPSCHDTPYYDYRDAKEQGASKEKPLKIAERELHFLKNLKKKRDAA